jgi:ribose-phosphate pyrophosphokinase
MQTGENKGQIVLIPLMGMEEVAEKIKGHLAEISAETSCDIVKVDLPRFATGDSKAVLTQSVRGKDVYILVDVGNYGCEYSMFGRKVCMSPDDHFQNLIRTISAIDGKAERVNVISPLLYSERQDRKISRESLDCAVALQQLANIGVSNIMAFDVHDDRVQNAIPFVGFDMLMPVYQTIKAMKREYPDIKFDEDNLVIVSPDFGGMNRNFMYANELGVDIGVFYKRRSRSNFANGKYGVEVHKYIGPDVTGRDVLMADDVIASGETMLDSVAKIKEYGAKRIFIAVTFGFFTEGVAKFNKAYEDGLLDGVFITNASYRREEILTAPWYREVDIRKYIAYYIFCVNTGKSISGIMDPHRKIQALMNRNTESR